MGWKDAAEAAVFPTHVGVNRSPIFKDRFCGSIPHACGGEPACEVE